MTIFNTRYLAKKYARNNQIVVKVEGGFAVMDYADYLIWKNQK